MTPGSKGITCVVLTRDFRQSAAPPPLAVTHPSEEILISLFDLAVVPRHILPNAGGLQDQGGEEGRQDGGGDCSEHALQYAKERGREIVFGCETAAIASQERPYSELLTKLQSQVGFLERSAASFDAGHEDEGEQLALRARVLLHDTKHSHSLLGQLRVKTALGYTDTSIHRERETRSLGGGLHAATVTQHAGLVAWQTTEPGSWTYAPVLRPDGEDRSNSPAAFDQWWKKPILKDTNGRPITRRSVVLDVANMDGGAHVAKAIPEAFRQLASGASLPVQVGSEDGSSSGIPGIVIATMRQIAFELLDTLHRDLPNFIGEGPLAASAQLTAAERSAIPRNSACPCESGKKFKACHGS